jgi:predicted transcriptional regulator
MRKTTKQPVALAAVTKAWDDFYSTTKVESEKELTKQGWKTVRTIAKESKLTIASITSRVQTLVGKRMVESKKATIQTNQGVREVNFYRPI